MALLLAPVLSLCGGSFFFVLIVARSILHELFGHDAMEDWHKTRTKADPFKLLPGVMRVRTCYTSCVRVCGTNKNMREFETVESSD